MPHVDVVLRRSLDNIVTTNPELSEHHLALHNVGTLLLLYPGKDGATMCLLPGSARTVGPPDPLVTKAGLVLSDRFWETTGTRRKRWTQRVSRPPSPRKRT